jgi:hypothetical protein
MPLITSDIQQARTAYFALELRANSAEQTAVTLQATVDDLASTHRELARTSGLLGQYAVSQLQTNSQLTVQQAGQVSPDITLGDFVASLGLAVALAEATMPGRAINSVKATVQSYLTFAAGPDGVSKVAGLRLYHPELGTPAALATTSFEIAKVATQPGTPAPRSLYAVLQDKQAEFSNPFWIQFAASSPPVRPADQTVAEIAKVFAQTGTWTFPFLVQEAAVIAGFETTIASMAANVAPPERAAAYGAVVAALTNLAKALDPTVKSRFVAGDLFALTAALDATTRIASAVRS